MDKQLPSVKPKVINSPQLTSYTKEESIRLITSSQLETVEKDIAYASLEKKVREYSNDETTLFMTGLIERTHINCGQKVDEQYVDLYLDEFISDLKKYNTNLSLKEIELAFKMGYKGEFGEWYGLNNKTYFAWINAFTFCEKRDRVKKLLKDRVLPEKQLSEKEKQEIIKQGCFDAFELFKTTGKCDDIGNVKYDYLFRNGVINFTVERRNIFKKEARENIVKEKKIELSKDNTRHVKLQIIDFIRDVEGNINSHAVIVEAKKIALNTFFREMIDIGTELKDLFNK